MWNTMFQHPGMVLCVLYIALFYARVCLFTESMPSLVLVNLRVFMRRSEQMWFPKELCYSLPSIYFKLFIVNCVVTLSWHCIQHSWCLDIVYDICSLRAIISIGIRASTLFCLGEFQGRYFMVLWTRKEDLLTYHLPWMAPIMITRKHVWWIS